MKINFKIKNHLKSSLAVILSSFLFGCSHSNPQSSPAPVLTADPTASASVPQATAPAGDAHHKHGMMAGDEEMKNWMHEMMADCHKKRMSMAKCHENMMKQCETKMGAERCKMMKEKMKQHPH